MPRPNGGKISRGSWGTSSNSPGRSVCRIAPTAWFGIAIRQAWIIGTRAPGDIFAYPAPARVRQPIGHISSQTGPNRWEYHPIYAEDLAPQPGAVFAPPKNLAPRG